MMAATTNKSKDIDGNDEFLTVTNNSTLNTGANKNLYELETNNPF